MKKVRTFLAAGLALAVMAMPARVEAQFLSGTWTGGSNFATTVSASLFYDQSSGVITLVINSFDGPGVIAAAGIVGLAYGVIDEDATKLLNTLPENDWEFDKTNQFGGDGLPDWTWAWFAPTPRPDEGIGGINGPTPGPWTFQFQTVEQQGGGYLSLAELANDEVDEIGFGIHAISNDECSTKLGVWDGGDSWNDNGPDGYDSNCVSVPEPSSLVLLATGAFGIAFLARRRREDEFDA